MLHFPRVNLIIKVRNPWFAKKIVLIDESQYAFQYHITHSITLIGRFKLCEPRVSRRIFITFFSYINSREIISIVLLSPINELRYNLQDLYRLRALPGIEK